MNQMLAAIEERKKEINDLCMELRWAYRGYFTPLYKFVDQKSFLRDVELFADRLVAYDDVLQEKERSMYQNFLISAILFLDMYCRPSDMILLSIYKIALVVEDSWGKGLNFSQSIYGYMFEPYENADDGSENYALLSKTIHTFAELYDDANVDKKDFPNHIVLMLDSLLFENKSSFLLDQNFENGVKLLRQQIGAAKYHLRRSLEEVSEDE